MKHMYMVFKQIMGHWLSLVKILRASESAMSSLYSPRENNLPHSQR